MKEYGISYSSSAKTLLLLLVYAACYERIVSLYVWPHRVIKYTRWLAITADCNNNYTRMDLFRVSTDCDERRIVRLNNVGWITQLFAKSFTCPLTWFMLVWWNRHNRQWRRNEFESGGAPVWRKASEHFYWSCPSTFLALKVQLVVLVNAFVMSSAVWSVFLFSVLLLTVPPVSSHL